jgi:hypothetical protein
LRDEINRVLLSGRMNGHFISEYPSEHDQTRAQEDGYLPLLVGSPHRSRKST